MHLQISSTQNKTVKRLIQLQEKSRNRKKEGVFVVEGFRELQLALKGNYQLQSLYYCEDLMPFDNLKDLSIPTHDIYQLSLEVYKKIAYRGSTEGVIALATPKNHSLAELKFQQKNPLLLIAEAPEKPGNIGAILRTADAARVDAVCIANPKTDLYNPNIIRSSVGCVFTNQIATGSTQEIIDFLAQNDIHFYAATLQNANVYTQEDFTKPTAIVVGTEADGLSEQWRTKATKNIYIPMQGEIDSMNVSVAAGILIFEAKRQRGYK